jgi:hexosaminidase
MKKSAWLVLAIPTLWAMSALASDAGQQLKLLPEPKEVQLHAGSFHVGSGTKILVQFGHQAEDRIAAETLAEEIADQSGLKLDIVGSKLGSRAVARSSGGAIILARLQDRRVLRFLTSQGMKADASVGAEGYLLFSDKSHLIVAANTGQGLFSGVQTLRQLLRADGKELSCPAVTIRDWPGLQVPHLGDISRTLGKIPEFLKQRARKQS